MAMAKGIRQKSKHTDSAAALTRDQCIYPFRGSDKRDKAAITVLHIEVHSKQDHIKHEAIMIEFCIGF
jgi:hypothetical protein